MKAVSAIVTHIASEAKAERKLRVLLVPDSIQWITGTIAKSIVEHNAWIDGTIISGPVLDIVARSEPDFFKSFDLVHFLCPYASKRWLPELLNQLPCVTSHHHVTDWDAQRHNLDGDAIVVGSEQWAADVIERGAPPERVFCVPYGVDVSQFTPASTSSRARVREELALPSTDVVVGFFAKRSSNEHDRKGTDVFATAIQQLSQELTNLAVLIIGPGWHDYIAALQAGGVRCVWLPYVKDSAAMARMYHALDFYWVTARVEGGPVTLLEAMSSSVCCVTTFVGLAREIVVDQVNGAIVPFDDAPSVASRTLALVHDSSSRTRIAEEARRTILGTMDVRLTTQRVQKVYESAIMTFEKRQAATHDDIVRPLRQPVGVSKEKLERIAILEQLAWAEMLTMHGQSAVGLRLIGRTWLRYPFSSLPARYLLRTLLPTSVTKALLWAKSAVSRPTMPQ